MQKSSFHESSFSCILIQVGLPLSLMANLVRDNFSLSWTDAPWEIPSNPSLFKGQPTFIHKL